MKKRLLRKHAAKTALHGTKTFRAQGLYTMIMPTDDTADSSKS